MNNSSKYKILVNVELNICPKQDRYGKNRNISGIFMSVLKNYKCTKT